MKHLTYTTSLFNRAFELASSIRTAYPTVPVSIDQVALEPAQWVVRVGKACGIAREIIDDKPAWEWPTPQTEAQVAVLMKSFGGTRL